MLYFFFKRSSITSVRYPTCGNAPGLSQGILERDIQRALAVSELVMESERAAICSDALGITVGDTILTQLSGKPVRLKVSQMSTHISDENVLCFNIAGKRYRKDGILGKRNEYLYIETNTK